MADPLAKRILARKIGEGNTPRGIDYAGDRDSKGSDELGEFTFEKQKMKEPLQTAL